MNTLPNDWDEFQKSLGASILQSSVWAKFQESLGRSVYFSWSNHWSWVGYKHNLKGVRYLFLPYGPTATLNSQDALRSVVKLAKREGFDFVRLEPMGKITPEDLLSVGARKVAEVEPEYTQVLDLRFDEQQLRRGLNSGHRNLINGTRRRGLKIEVSQTNEDFEEFLKMLHDTARRAKVKFYSDNYFWTIKKNLEPSGNAKLYIARSKQGPVASALFYDYNGTRYYAHAGAYQDINRRLNGSVSLLWQAILDAKNANMTSFDLWGVAPSDDVKHKWAGISKFKKGFGGTTIQYLGTYDIPLNNIKYKLYKAYCRIRGRG
jgi:lipid II:glycine glycyltransferase (peptidoglycan interpeptide bridge formation enzyme)